MACAQPTGLNNQADGKLFDRSAFTYEPDTDSYRCPAGRVLVRNLHRRKRNVAYIVRLLWLRSQAAMHHCRAPIYQAPSGRGPTTRMNAEPLRLMTRRRRCRASLRHHQADDGRRKVLTRDLKEREPKWLSPSSPTTCSASSTSRPYWPETKKEAPITGAPSFPHT